MTADGRFLVLAPRGRDAPLTVSLLERAGLEGRSCRDAEELCAEVAIGAAGLIIAEEALGPRAVDRLATVLAAQPPWSDLPVVVFAAEGARDPAPGLVEALGNVILLDRPLRPVTMVSAARSVLRARRRQYAAREYIRAQEHEVRQRDQFLAMLGHELRNPLGVILLAAEMIGRGDLQQQQEIIKRQGRHLSRLVDDLLDVARVTSGKVVLQRKHLDLNEVVERAVSSVRAAVEAQRQSLAFRGAGTDAFVEGDVVRLDQIFGNLLTNAVKYTPPGGHIFVSVECDERVARVRVRDDGIGISPEMLPRVFELFAQAENSIDRAQGGLGIGLTLVRSLVLLHGGQVAVTSRGPGRGSEFVVTLPRVRAAHTSDGMRSSSAPSLTAARSTIVVIEDNADSRELLRTLLEAFGHRVHVAADGEEGLARVLAVQPDVVIIDIGLPKVDGYTVARKVRAALGSDALLVALTGYNQPDDKRRASEAGFDVHYAKPVDPERLQRLLATRASASPRPVSG